LSRLRARCPDCRTYTAVALGPEYECHSCGRSFRAGLVRVPRAWGDGGEPMVEAAALPLAYPEAAVVDEETLGEQTLAVASDLPERPLVLGGCCCSHVGAIEGLAARHGRIGVVWLDAHGDLNTPETSPSGNEWGMPLRMAIDGGAVDPGDVVLVGARNLDPPEQRYIESSGLHLGAEGLDAALGGTAGVYVALDADVVDERELASFMPEPGGLRLAQVEALLERVREGSVVLGAGLTGLRPEPRSVEPLERLAATLLL
jgi:arginase family enzyme